MTKDEEITELRREIERLRGVLRIIVEAEVGDVKGAKVIAKLGLLGIGGATAPSEDDGETWP